jgi:4Fe-4S ferredoxin
VVYKIDMKKCLKCGLCVVQCPQKAIVLDKKVKESDGLILYTVHIDQKKCTECDICFSFEWWCPAKAIVKV